MHIILIVFALQGHWMPPAFLFYNILFIISLFWSIQCNASIDAIHTVSLKFNSIKNCRIDDVMSLDFLNILFISGSFNQRN